MVNRSNNVLKGEDKMFAKVIQIDEEKCIGCGLCANACHQSAIQAVEITPLPEQVMSPLPTASMRV